MKERKRERKKERKRYIYMAVPEREWDQKGRSLENRTETLIQSRSRTFLLN